MFPPVVRKALPKNLKGTLALAEQTADIQQGCVHKNNPLHPKNKEIKIRYKYN